MIPVTMDGIPRAWWATMLDIMGLPQLLAEQDKARREGLGK
jgi:hypothetical protein